jgi:hypothetical protein
MGRRSKVPHTRDQLKALSPDELTTHIRSLRIRVRFLEGPQRRRLEKDLAAAEIIASSKLNTATNGRKTKA